MGKYTNEIEQFIYEICYRPIREAVYTYIYEHPYALNLDYSRIKFPDIAILEDMILEFFSNIRTNEDTLLFDAIVSCTINLTEEGYNGQSSCDLNQWLTISCEAVIKDKLEKLTIIKIEKYASSVQQKNDEQAVPKNIVPIIYKKDLDSEANAFLSEYYPEALITPLPVPITYIAEKMGLEVIQGHRITDDFSVFGQICFSAGKASVYDLFKCSHHQVEVQRGTILIDAYTYLERNLDINILR